MLTSLALIFIFGIFAGEAARRLKLPPLFGMLLAGILLGPSCLNLLSDSMLSLSAELRQLALVIILLRAGLSLNIQDLRKVGRPAILMCFLPACFEIIAIIIIAPMLFAISTTEAALLGSVLAAVSPAVIVPKMLKLMDAGYGTEKSIPQLILAGASVDDVFVIVLFSIFTSLAIDGTFSAMSLTQIPCSIILGILAGMIAGLLMHQLLQMISSHSLKVLLLLSAALLLTVLETLLKGRLALSGLLAVMSMGIIIQKKEKKVQDLSKSFSSLWSGGEILLFVLVGAAVKLNYAVSAGWQAFGLIFIVLMIRMLGVFCCLLKTNLNKNEKLFCMLAYTPKATVQAAIGSIPLSIGLACGELILTIAVLAILITAPLGAFMIDSTYQHLLKKID